MFDGIDKTVSPCFPLHRRGPGKGLFYILLLLSLPCFSQNRDTFDVYFPLNDPRLTQAAKDRIDMLIFKDTLIHGQKFIILGYADHLGDDKHNDVLSSKRATSVKDYMVSMGFTASDISICIGKGKINRAVASKEGIPTDRKVQIIITPQEPPPPPKPVPAKTTPKPQTLDITHINVNQAIAIKNIFFRAGTAQILSGSYPSLELLYTMLNNNPTVRIRLEGHVCCKARISDGNIIYLPDEHELSVNRAEAVYNYLVGKGIAANRMEYTGFGNTRPAVEYAADEMDMEANRRVEIRILQK